MNSGKKLMNNTVGAAVEKIELDNKISLRALAPLFNVPRKLKLLFRLFLQANIHRQMKNIVDLYTTLLKFASIITETIPIHQKYIASNQAEKSYYKKKLLLALEEMESLKPQVQKRTNEIRNGHAANIRHRVEKPETSGSDRQIPNHTTSLHLEIKQNSGTSGPCVPPRGSRTEQKCPESGPSSSTATAIPSDPPIESLFIDDGPIPPYFVDSNPVDATTSMVNRENLNVKEVEEKGNTSASTSCVICLDAPIEGACVPCGHMAGCMSCLNEIKAKKMSCPVCRAKVELVLRLYAV
ncbi:unnamed protein product [Fraxinus pennsylvanica]|uniref:RING-type domain-containing protein n=1 Tax=Fraxinus pennsylvanica TaxID=56036 RepID=A0AAD2DQP7_9LAMI|nr:unnamed protein product [Fraxinus pennsylvanica]